MSFIAKENNVFFTRIQDHTSYINAISLTTPQSGILPQSLFVFYDTDIFGVLL